MKKTLAPPSSPRRSRLFYVMATLALIELSLFRSNNAVQLAQAYVTSGLPARTQKAWLQKLTDDICLSEPGSLSQEEVINAPMLMSAWATSPLQKNKIGSDGSGKKRAMAVESLLKRLIDERRAGNCDAIVKTEDYNAVMKAWAMSGEKSAAAQRAEEILMNMQDMCAGGDENIQPNLESFEIVIEAWSKAFEDDEPNAPARAQRILEWMTNIYLSAANDLAMPHSSTFYLVLKTWAHSGKMEAPIVAENLVMTMQHLLSQGMESAKPNTACFNAVMSTWLKSGDIAAEARIRQIFEYMGQCSRKGFTDIKPDSSSYNIVISSISPAVKNAGDSGGARRADKILARLEQGFLAGDESLRPDTIIYNQVIDYWAKTQTVRGHFLKARDVLDRQICMHKSGVRKCRPDTTGYTSVMAACASTFGPKVEKKRAFDMAHQTFIECCKNQYTKPNDVTYGIMLKAAGRLLPTQDERDRYAETLFKMCCDDGCLGEMAFNRMKEAVSPGLLSKLTNDKNYNELPGRWKKGTQAVQRKLKP